MTAEANLDLFQSLLDSSPFQQWLGLRVLDFDRGGEWLILALAFDPKLARMSDSRQLHGGAIAAAIDIAGAALLGLRYRVPVATVDYHVDYLRPVHDCDLTMKARLRKAGRTINVVDIEAEDAEMKLVALGRARYATPSGAR